jgi:hypothetical protein
MADKEPLKVKLAISLWQYAFLFTVPIIASLALRNNSEELGWAVVGLVFYYFVRRIPWLWMAWKSQYRYWQWSKTQG